MALFVRWQIDEEDAVEPLASRKLGRKFADIIARRDEKNVARVIVKPREQRSEHPRRNARVGLPRTGHATECLLDFVTHQHTRCHRIGDRQGASSSLLRLTDERTHQAADIEHKRWSAGLVAERFRELRLPATGRRKEHHTTRPTKRIRTALPPHRPLTEGFYRLKPTKVMKRFAALMKPQQAALLERLGLQFPNRIGLHRAMANERQRDRTLGFVAS